MWHLAKAQTVSPVPFFWTFSLAYYCRPVHYVILKHLIILYIPYCMIMHYNNTDNYNYAYIIIIYDTLVYNIIADGTILLYFADTNHTTMPLSLRQCCTISSSTILVVRVLLLPCNFVVLTLIALVYSTFYFILTLYVFNHLFSLSFSMCTYYVLVLL